MPKPIYWTPEKKQEAFARIIARIKTGESVRSIVDKADRKNYPSFKILLQWIQQDESMKSEYYSVVGKNVNTSAEVDSKDKQTKQMPEPPPEATVMDYFRTAAIPSENIILPNNETVTNVRAFINHYTQIVEWEGTSPTGLTAISRLERLRDAIITKNKS